MRAAREILASGAMWTGLGVGLGAFGAHGLKARLSPEMLTIFQTGVQYQQLHGLALLGLAAAVPHLGEARAKWISRLFQFGILVFAGSLYALALSGTRTWGAVTPLGGVAFLSGWGLLLYGAVKGSDRASEQAAPPRSDH